MNRVTTFRLNENLYKDVKSKVLKKSHITATDFITRCMVLSLFDDDFRKMVDSTWWNYAEQFHKTYKK